MRRGSMDMGTSLLIIAIIGGLLLSSYWDRMPQWLGIVCCILLALIILAGIADLLFGFKGMGHNLSQQEVDDLHEQHTIDNDSEQK